MKPVPIRSGCRHPNAALKPEQVEAVRKRCREQDDPDYEELAREMHCSRWTISRCAKKITYRG